MVGPVRIVAAAAVGDEEGFLVGGKGKTVWLTKSVATGRTLPVSGSAK